MSRIWSSGFELQSVTDGVEMDTFSGTPAIDTTTKRSGAASLRLNTSATTKYARHQCFGTGTIIYARFYVYFATLPNATEDICAILDNVEGGWVGIRCASDGTLTLYDGGNAATLDTAAGTVSTGQWYLFELYLSTPNTTWSWEWRIDTVSEGSGTLSAPGVGGQFFVNVGSVASPWAGGSGASTYDIYFDDIAVNDTAGSAQTSWPGAGSIVHMHPTAAGDAAATTGVFSAVDEVTPNDATDYIEQDTIAEVDYNFETSANAGIGASDTITLVQIGTRQHPETAALAGWRALVMSQSGGTTTYGTAKTHDDTTWKTNGDALPQIYSLTSYTDPQGGGAWTPALLDTMQAGMDVTDATPNLFVSTIWALVEYVSAGGNPAPSVSDSTIPTDSSVLTSSLNISVEDSTTPEDILPTQYTDAVEARDVISASLTTFVDIFINVTDETTPEDSIIVQIPKNYINVIDSTTPADDFTIQIPKLYISVEDSSSPDDSVSVQIPSLGNIIIVESTAPDDIATVSIPDNYISIIDSTIPKDSITILESAAVTAQVGYKYIPYRNHRFMR